MPGTGRGSGGGRCSGRAWGGLARVQLAEQDRRAGVRGTRFRWRRSLPSHGSSTRRRAQRMGPDQWMALCFMVMGPALLQRLAVGWWLVAVGGWRWLVVGGRWFMGLAGGGWWRLAAGSGWRLAVGDPWGLSLRAVLNNKKFQLLKDSPEVEVEVEYPGILLLLPSFSVLEPTPSSLDNPHPLNTPH